MALKRCFVGSGDKTLPWPKSFWREKFLGGWGRGTQQNWHLESWNEPHPAPGEWCLVCAIIAFVHTSGRNFPIKQCHRKTKSLSCFWDELKHFYLTEQLVKLLTILGKRKKNTLASYTSQISLFCMCQTLICVKKKKSDGQCSSNPKRKIKPSVQPTNDTSVNIAWRYDGIKIKLNYWWPKLGVPSSTLSWGQS